MRPVDDAAPGRSEVIDVQMVVRGPFPGHLAFRRDVHQFVADELHALPSDAPEIGPVHILDFFKDFARHRQAVHRKQLAARQSFEIMMQVMRLLIAEPAAHAALFGPPTPDFIAVPVVLDNVIDPFLFALLDQHEVAIGLQSIPLPASHLPFVNDVPVHVQQSGAVRLAHDLFVRSVVGDKRQQQVAVIGLFGIVAGYARRIDRGIGLSN